MHLISDNDIETVLHGTLQGGLQGTFHTPEMTAASLSMTSYVSPNTQVYPNYAIGAPAMMWVEAAAPEAVQFPFMITDSGERLDIAQYNDCKADSGIDQINGVVIICDAGSTEDDLQSPEGKYHYQRCQKLGAGAQINGLEIVYHGGTRAPRMPAMPGRWDKMDMLNAEGREIKGSPKNQINGGRVRLMKRTEMGAMGPA